MHNLAQDIDFIRYIQDWAENVSLEDKVTHAKKILEHIARHIPSQKIAIAWTGGKDSTVLLSLWREVLAKLHPDTKPLVINLDTGHKFPEIVSFRDALAADWNLDMHITRPDWKMLCKDLKIASPADYPVAENHVQCCRDLKILPLERAIHELGVQVLLTGVRADEHPDRAKRGMVETCQSHLPNALHNAESSEHLRIHPLFAFTEMDIWAYTASHNIPYCPLYTQGYRSLGCVPCTQISCGLLGGDADSGERAGRNQDKEGAMQVLHELGYF